MSALALHTMRFHQLLRRVRRPLARLIEQLALEQHTPVIDRLLMQLIKDHQGEFSGSTPRIVRSLRTRSDLAVFMIGDIAGAPATKVLKLPLTPDAQQSTTLHRQVVTTLHGLPELQEFCSLVPRALAWGRFEGQAYYLETALGGVAASDLVRQQAEPAMFKQQATRAILQLQAGTVRRELVDETLFATLAGNNLALLYRLTERWPDAALLRDKLQLIETCLRSQIAGRELPLVWTHGDYWPGNILVRPVDGRLRGIVDWDRASPQQLPLLDVLHLLVFTRMMQRRSNVGEELVSYFLPARFDPATRALIDQTLAQLRLPSDSAFLHAATLLYWSRFAAVNLSRYPSFQSDGRWLSKNVFFVLKRCMA